MFCICNLIVHVTIWKVVMEFGHGTLHLLNFSKSFNYINYMYMYMFINWVFNFKLEQNQICCFNGMFVWLVTMIIRLTLHFCILWWFHRNKWNISYDFLFSNSVMWHSSDVRFGSQSVWAPGQWMRVWTQHGQKSQVHAGVIFRIQYSPFSNIPKINAKTFSNISEIRCIASFADLSKISGIAASFANVSKICTKVPFPNIPEVGCITATTDASEIHRRSLVPGVVCFTRRCFQQVIVQSI